MSSKRAGIRWAWILAVLALLIVLAGFGSTMYKRAKIARALAEAGGGDKPSFVRWMSDAYQQEFSEARLKVGGDKLRMDALNRQRELERADPDLMQLLQRSTVRLATSQARRRGLTWPTETDIREVYRSLLYQFHLTSADREKLRAVLSGATEIVPLPKGQNAFLCDP